jgi:hypothetical protein
MQYFDRATKRIAKAAQYSIHLFKSRYLYCHKNRSNPDRLLIPQEKYVEVLKLRVHNTWEKYACRKIHAQSFILISTIERLHGKCLGLKIRLLIFVVTTVRRVSVAEHLAYSNVEGSRRHVSVHGEFLLLVLD